MVSGRSHFKETLSNCCGVIESSLHLLSVIVFYELYLAFMLILSLLIGFTVNAEKTLVMLLMAGMQAVVAAHINLWNDPPKYLLIFAHAQLAVFSTELLWTDVLTTGVNGKSALLLCLSILQYAHLMVACSFSDLRVDYCCDKNRRASGKNNSMSLESNLTSPSDLVTAIEGTEAVTDERTVDDIFPILHLPNELIRKIYGTLPLKVRRAIRCNNRLAQIELGMRYEYVEMTIHLKRDGVHLQFLYDSDDNVVIPHAEFKREMEIMESNSDLDFITYKADNNIQFEERTILGALKHVKARCDFEIYSTAMNDESLMAAVQLTKNRSSLRVYESIVTTTGLFSIYEQMLRGELDLCKVIFGLDGYLRHEGVVFLERFGNYDRDNRTFSTNDPRIQIISNDGHEVIFRVENRLLVQVYFRYDEVAFAM